MSQQTEHAAAEASCASDLSALQSAAASVEAVAANLKADRAAFLQGDPMARQTLMSSQALAFLTSARAAAVRLLVAARELEACT